MQQDDEDGDTDSVASDASSVNHPRMRSAPPAPPAAAAASGVSPLNRRRSLRLQAIAAQQVQFNMYTCDLSALPWIKKCFRPGQIDNLFFFKSVFLKDYICGTVKYHLVIFTNFIIYLYMKLAGNLSKIFICIMDRYIMVESCLACYSHRTQW